MKYNVRFRSVDGAGYLRDKPDYATQSSPWDPCTEFSKEEAERVAAEEQAKAEQDGNPWGYRYQAVPAR